MERYARQVNLPEIGVAGQEKLRGAAVLCVGAGGLGAPALLYLAAAGVGRIGIIDHDHVEESNLQRQVIFTAADVGRPKAAAAAARVRALNPEIRVDVYEEALHDGNAPALFAAYDLVIDGTDNFETKFLINDAALKYGRPWVYGAIQGFDGQAGLFNYQGGACYRCLRPAKPQSAVMNCAEAGVIGAVAGLVGVTQALQAIQILTGHESFAPLGGRLWVIDARTMRTQDLTVPKNPDCPGCSRKKDDIILSYSAPLCAAVPEIDAASLRAGGDYVVIDVREEEEWRQGVIEGALLWPLSALQAGRMPEIERGRRIVLYCQKGVRSREAGRLMKAGGFADLVSLAGGYEVWAGPGAA